MKLLTISLLALSLSGIAAHAQTDAAAVKINLGRADNFALLGASGITNVGPQNIHNWRCGQFSDTLHNWTHAISSEGSLVP